MRGGTQSSQRTSSARVVDEAAAQQMADMLLAAMSGEVVARALLDAGAVPAVTRDGIKARAHAFFEAALRSS